jgi:hypothetical protein
MKKGKERRPNILPDSHCITVKIKEQNFPGVKIKIIMQNKNPRVSKAQQVKKGTTILGKFWSLVVEQSTTALFKFITMNFPQIIPLIMFMIFVCDNEPPQSNLSGIFNIVLY